LLYSYNIEEEITEAVTSSDGNRSPGPHGFNFSFLKIFLVLIREEFGALFNQLFFTASLPKSLSSYFVALIPKVDFPPSHGEFRLISLLGTLYKLDPSRLASVVDKIISSDRSTIKHKYHLAFSERIGKRVG
jgi:hypothetical protein